MCSERVDQKMKTVHASSLRVSCMSAAPHTEGTPGGARSRPYDIYIAQMPKLLGHVQGLLAGSSAQIADASLAASHSCTSGQLDC